MNSPTFPAAPRVPAEPRAGPEATEQVLRAICEAFQETGTWPRYRELEVRFRKSGPLELAIEPLFPGVIRVYGDWNDSELRLASLVAYRDCARAEEDVARFIDSARLFAARYIEQPGGEPRVEGQELRERFGLDERAALRLCRLIDDFGGVLERGGGRGDTLDQWSFSVSSRAMYFEDVATLEDFERQREIVAEIEQLQAGRSRPWHYAPEGLPSTVPTAVRSLDFPSIEWRLHPAVVQSTARLFSSGHFSEAVRSAMQRFEYYLQDTLKDYDTSGRRIVAKALGNGGTIRLNTGSTAQERDEQEGFFHLASGAMLAFRNFHSHGRSVEISAEDAIEQLAVVSSLFRRIDAAVNQHTSTTASTIQPQS